jgi:integrase
LAGFLAAIADRSRGPGLKATTVAKYRTHFRSLARFQAETPGYGVGLGDIDRIRQPRMPRERLALALTRDEERRVLEACSLVRDRLILELFLATGVRVSEMAGLVLPNLQLTARPPRIAVTGSVHDPDCTKSGRPRQVTFRKSYNGLPRRLLDWIRGERDPFGRCPRQELFLSAVEGRREGQVPTALGIWGYERLCERVSLRAGVHFSPHMLRHTWATRLVDAGVQPIHLMEVGGWNSIRKPLLVRHARWSKTHARWSDDVCALPISPTTNSAVLLTPRRFLRHIPSVTAWGFWNWAGTTAAETLRDDLNYDLAESLTKAEKEKRAREVARARPQLAVDYVSHVAEIGEHEPYNSEDDPDLLVGWHEAGRLAFDPEEVPADQPSPEGFCEWVRVLLLKFQQAVEDKDLWRVLWDDAHKQPRHEPIVQAVAGSLLSAYCEAADVDLSREANIGRGPVDFKFSKGWHKRALAEVKLISSSHFEQGAKKQLPQYLRSERIECGYYLCVGFFDRDFAEERLARVRDTCSALSSQKGVRMMPLIVDARPKTSASKL